MILIAVIIVVNHNAIWLCNYAITSSIQTTFFGNTLPRFLHDIFSIYGVIFWIWQVYDAYLLAKKTL
jgi:hypothetical protein